MADEPDLEPFDFAEHGTTEQAQAALDQRQPGKKKPLPVHDLPEVFVRPDAGERAPLAQLRDRVLPILQGDNPGVSLERLTLYFDLWLEYAEAQNCIDRRGVICLHPRTSVIIENPYLNRRDKTRSALGQIRDVEAAWLWTPGNLARMKAWLDAAIEQRDADLARAEMNAAQKGALGDIGG